MHLFAKELMLFFYRKKEFNHYFLRKRSLPFYTATCAGKQGADTHYVLIAECQNVIFIYGSEFPTLL